jgi:alpha-ketoglutarate-dependent taurine dioxygenase
MWDNRSIMQCVIPDFTEHRLMHRVSVVGRPE